MTPIRFSWKEAFTLDICQLGGVVAEWRWQELNEKLWQIGTFIEKDDHYVICAARFHAHVSLAGKERVTLSVRSGGTNR